MSPSLTKASGLERAKPGSLSLVHWLVQQNHRDLFPKLPEYSRYHRIARNAEALWAELALYIARKLPGSARKLIDAKPLPVAKGKRAQWAKLPEARKGFSIRSHQQGMISRYLRALIERCYLSLKALLGMVYGFQLHAVVSEQGLDLLQRPRARDPPEPKHLVSAMEEAYAILTSGGILSASG